MIRWWRRFFSDGRVANAVTMADVVRMKVEIDAEGRREDALLDEYFKTDYPKVKKWMRRTEVSPPELVEMADDDHLRLWLAWRRSQPGPRA